MKLFYKQTILYWTLFLTSFFISCSKSNSVKPHSNNSADTTNNTTSGSLTADVVTYAGTVGVQGLTNNGALNSSFYWPSGVAVDVSDNIYIADRHNNLIRKIGTNGMSSTIAGTVLGGNSNGPAQNASFLGPQGIAVDTYGNIYIADTDNNLIRKIDVSGMVTTLAGSGKVGSENGVGDSASFNQPTGVAVDSKGNVYVAEYGGNLIRKITSDGTVSTFAGSSNFGTTDGQGILASFFHPIGIAIDINDIIYVADESTGLIRKINQEGLVSTFASSSYSEYSPYRFNGITVDHSGNIYIDTQSGQIFKVSQSGLTTFLAGQTTETFKDGIGANASFKIPEGIAINSNGDIIIADVYNDRIRKLSTNSVVSTIAGNGNEGNVDQISATFTTPEDVAIDASGNVYVADYFNSVIRKITPNKIVSTYAGGGPTIDPITDELLPKTFYAPYGIKGDANGNMYVADKTSYSILKINSTGVVTTFAGNGNIGHANGMSTSASFYFPTSVAVDKQGNVFVADSYNNMIRKITPAGMVTTVAGDGSKGLTNGLAAQASFNTPTYVAVDDEGNIYVSDSGNNLIRKISSSGVVSTFLENSFTPKNGKGETGNIKVVGGIAIDSSSGNLYVSDINGNKIYMVTPDGIVRTLAGSGASGSEDGASLNASFHAPSGLAVDSEGNLYVADLYNSLIRKIIIHH